MRSRTVGWVALSTLLLTNSWLVLLILDQARAGPLETYAQALAHVRRLDAVYFATYICAGLLTATTAMLMAGLYGLARDAAFPTGALMGVVFVPVYATLNLFVYFSQVTVVPALLHLADVAPSPSLDSLLLQMIHLSPGSAIGFANALAYAALAVPSVLFGLLLAKQSAAGDIWPRLAGGLLALSGALSVAGFLALLVAFPPLDWGLVAGGVAYSLALFPLSFTLLRDRPDR